MSPSPISPKLFGTLNILRLTALVASTKKYYQPSPVSSDVDSVSCSYVDAEFQYSFADGLAITERSRLNLTQSFPNSHLCIPVSKAFKPRIEWAITLGFPVNDQVEHRGSVA